MKFIEVHQSRKLRYSFYEADSNSKNYQTSFKKGNQYIWTYKLVSYFPQRRKLIISGENLNFNDNKTEIFIKKSSPIQIETIFNIIFSPQNDTNSVYINLFIIKSFREPEIIFIREEFLTKPDIKKIKIDGYLEINNSNIVKVGEQKNIVFLFKNQSQQHVTGVNITIK